MHLSKIVRGKTTIRSRNFWAKPNQASFRTKGLTKCDRNHLLILMNYFRPGWGVPGWLVETSETKQGRKLPRPTRCYFWNFLGSYISTIYYGWILILWRELICVLSWINIFPRMCLCTSVKNGVKCLSNCLICKEIIFLPWILDQLFFFQGKNKAASDQEANAGLTKEQRMERWELICRERILCNFIFTTLERWIFIFTTLDRWKLTRGLISWD